jgi:hypothetical protein
MYGWVVVSSFSCKNVEPHFSLKLISVYVSVARALSPVGQRPTWPALFFLTSKHARALQRERKGMKHLLKKANKHSW